MTHVLVFTIWLALQDQNSASKPSDLRTNIEEILASGRIVSTIESPSQRVSTRKKVAPGLPPLLSFRYYEGQAHHRFGNTELVLDDAGH
jgi:hypothetical protein